MMISSLIQSTVLIIAVAVVTSGWSKYSFRNQHGDDGEESGSDWDEYTPRTTPTHKPPSTPPGRPAEDTPTLTSTIQTTGGVQKPTESQEPLFSALPTATPPQIQAPPTPAIYNPVYRISLDEGTQTDHTPHIVAVEHTTEIGRDVPQQNHHSGSVFEFQLVGEEGAKRLLMERDPPSSFMGKVAERSEKFSRRCAEEIFSTLRVLTDCLIAFLLACTQFILYHLLRKLCCGLMVVLADAICKPTLTDFFNAILWPFCSCLWHVGRAVKMCLGPCLEVTGTVVSQCALLISSFRLVEVSINKRGQTHHA